jgi:hypothetical protein
MEQLSQSKYIADIYGYCSTSALTEFATGGNLQSILFHSDSISKLTLLEMAYNVAQAVADTHFFSKRRGTATIAHTDLNPNQFLQMGNVFKLNDFNRAKLISWNATSDHACSIQTNINWRATYQSPEEHSGNVQSEKVDVFTMGLVLYKIYTRNGSLFPGKSPSERREFVSKGGHAKIPILLESEHPLDRIMPTVLQKCWITDPTQRPSAQEIADLLRNAMDES